jgi:hypothetical protein
MIAEENKGKKKKFKEGQAEQVLDDLFFEAIKGVFLNFTKFYMRILFKVKNWRISQIYLTTNIISHSKEKCPVSFLRHTLMLYKDNLKPKYAYCDDIRDFFKRDDIPEELFNLDIFDASAPCTISHSKEKCPVSFLRHTKIF